jgi:hypothetical protein
VNYGYPANGNYEYSYANGEGYQKWLWHYNTYKIIILIYNKIISSSQTVEGSRKHYKMRVKHSF